LGFEQADTGKHDISTGRSFDTKPTLLVYRANANSSHRCRSANKKRKQLDQAKNLSDWINYLLLVEL
jgi:hypothetical protein